MPFAKTGGLADVCGTLPIKLAALGHHTTLVMPAFRSIRECGEPIETTDISFAIPMGDRKVVGARVLKSLLPGSSVPVWFIDQPQYFDRESLYGDGAGDYPDNSERFAFFCRAAIQAIGRMEGDIDIVHCNDWQTGLVPAFLSSRLKTLHENIIPKNLKNAASIYTIHNLAYQGGFPTTDFPLTGLGWEDFHHDTFEFYGSLNFMKSGIVTADQITTVSPRYAMEICQPEQGCGLDAVLRTRDERLSGIINGIDNEVWNPQTDPNLTARYDIEKFEDGKWANKQSLQVEFGLEESADVPLIGLVGRLASQKGWDLILPVLKQHLDENRPTQWIVLGSGDPSYEQQLLSLAKAYPSQLALHVGFSDILAHRIEAGSDLFVMPSHYEPCGLNQLYSLRYGTVPIVTCTGGLADTVTNCTAETIANGTADGFYLDEKTPEALDAAIGKALHIRYHQKETWMQMIRTGMGADFSWRKSANQYAELYEKTKAIKHASLFKAVKTSVPASKK